MAKLEIERKFLLKRIPESVGLPKYDIVQYYGNDLIGDFRLRIQREAQFHENGPDMVPKYILTRKKKVSKGVFEEDEREVDWIFFANYMPLYDTMITKYRYVIEQDGLKFEVDKYTSLHLVTLEVELPTIKHKFSFPKKLEMHWNLIKEVTGDKAFSNRMLSTPFK